MASTFANVWKNQEVILTDTTETELTETSYTVPAGKTFYLCGICGTSNTDMIIMHRLYVDTNSPIKWCTTVTGNSTANVIFTHPIVLATGEQTIVIKVQSNGTVSTSVWSAYWGYIE